MYFLWQSALISSLSGSEHWLKNLVESSEAGQRDHYLGLWPEVSGVSTRLCFVSADDDDLVGEAGGGGVDESRKDRFPYTVPCRARQVHP